MKKVTIKKNEITEPQGNDDIIRIAKEKGHEIYGTKSTNISISGLNDIGAEKLAQSFSQANLKGEDITNVASTLKILQDLKKSEKNTESDISVQTHTTSVNATNKSNITPVAVSIAPDKQKTETLQKQERNNFVSGSVVVGGVSMPSNLANSIFKDSITAREKQKIKRDGNFEFLLEQYHSPAYKQHQDFLKKQMSKIVKSISDTFTHEYYDWIINNLEHLSLQDLKNPDIYEAQKTTVQPI